MLLVPKSSVKKQTRRKRLSWACAFNGEHTVWVTMSEDESSYSFRFGRKQNFAILQPYTVKMTWVCNNMEMSCFLSNDNDCMIFSAFPFFKFLSCCFMTWVCKNMEMSCFLSSDKDGVRSTAFPFLNFLSCCFKSRIPFPYIWHKEQWKERNIHIKLLMWNALKPKNEFFILSCIRHIRLWPIAV